MAKTSSKAHSSGKGVKTFRGHEVLAVTKDGVRILKPKGKATHFTTKEIREAVAHGTASRPRLGSPGALNDRWGRARVSGLDRRAGLFSAWGSGGACRIPRESWLGVEWLVWRRRRRSRR